MSGNSSVLNLLLKNDSFVLLQQEVGNIRIVEIKQVKIKLLEPSFFIEFHARLSGWIIKWTKELNQFNRSIIIAIR